MNPIGSTRLSMSKDFVRPKQTVTDLLQTKTNIEDQLKDFDEIQSDEIVYVPINSQLRYLSYDKKNKKELYRFGGLLRKVEKEYVILAGKEGMTFSVQRYTRNDKGDIIHKTRFFKKKKPEEKIKEEMEEAVEISQKTIESLTKAFDKQKKELMMLRRELDKYQGGLMDEEEEEIEHKKEKKKEKKKDRR